MEFIFAFSIIIAIFIILFAIVGAIITLKFTNKGDFYKKESIDEQLLENAEPGNNSKTVTDFVDYFENNSPTLYSIKGNVYE